MKFWRRSASGLTREKIEYDRIGCFWLLAVVGVFRAKLSANDPMWPLQSFIVGFFNICGVQNEKKRRTRTNNVWTVPDLVLIRSRGV